MTEHDPTVTNHDTSPAPGSSGMYATSGGAAFSPGEAIGEYVIVREISRGGMGVVYLAEQQSLSRQVALKVLPHQYAASELQVVRLHREAKAAAKLRHPNIVQVYAVGEHRGTHSIAMEFIDGIDLARELEQRHATVSPGRLGHVQAISPVERTVSIVAQLAEALEYAHVNGIIHRDIKPQNILLDRGDVPRLTDFGLAKDVNDISLSQPGELAGTPAYMSPEQALSKRVHIDHRTDIYSLGVVLYEMLTLHRPFQGRSQQEILYSISFRPAPPIRKLNPRIARDLRILCEKAIEKNPDDRFATAGEFAAELRRYLNHEPIHTAPPSVVRRLTAKLRQNRAAAAITTIFVLGLVIGGLLINGALGRARAACRISVTSQPTGADVYVASFPQSADAISAWRSLGVTPLTEIAVARGRHRLLVVSSDGRFSEGDFRFFEAGEKRTIHVPLFHTADVTGNMVQIAGDIYALGNPPGGPFQEPRSVELEPFFIDECETTNGDFVAYMNASGASPPLGWPTNPSENFLVRPVVALTADQSEAYARWFGKRLPTVAEWEAACCGKERRNFPWGNDPPASWPEVSDADRRKAGQPDEIIQRELYDRYTVPSRSQPELHSPEGLFHLAGNVHELTSSWDLHTGRFVMAKGGSWLNDWTLLELWTSTCRPGEPVSFQLGFRCVRSARPSSTIPE